MSDDSQEPEIFRALRGVRKIVINTCHGGFGLSYCGRLAYLIVSNTPYHVRYTRDPDWLEDGPAIWVAGQPMEDRNIARDDPCLVWVVENMGKIASNRFSELKVVEIPWDVDWQIEEYDGREWVAEKHRTWE